MISFSTGKLEKWEKTCFGLHNKIFFYQLLKLGKNRGQNWENKFVKTSDDFFIKASTYMIIEKCH